MTLILDTSGLYAALNPRERTHEACLAAVTRAIPPLVLSPFVLAELDYLLLSRAGVGVELALLDDVARGVYGLAPFSPPDVAQARAVAAAYEDPGLGLADASVLVLCERYDTVDLLTLDARLFRAVTVAGRPLRLLPEDGVTRAGALQGGVACYRI